jgi:transposase
MKTKDARSLPPAAQEALRIRAVLAVKGGLKHVAVARLFGITRQTVDAWVRRYRKRGMRALRAVRRGRPLGTQLTAQQGRRLKRLIVGRYPEQLRLRCCLWTRDAVRELIRRRHGLKLSVWTVGRYLQAWGFTPQKPKRRAYEQNPEAVQRWLATDYPAIQRQAKREKAEIHWLDQMGMRSDHQTGRSYGLKGHTPVIPGTGKRFRCNLISAVTNRGALRFMIYRRKFQAPVMIDFLRRLMRDRARPIYVIADRHPVHCSAAVRAWLRKQAGRIRFYQLPSYSPELNPDEMLNNDVKSNALGRKRPKDEKEMIRGARSYLRKRQRHPEVVRRYFHEESVRYAAA